MLKNTFRLLVLFSTIICSAQVDQRETISLLLGYGMHGSGDLTGYQYAVRYSKDLGTRWSWNLEFGGSLHDAADDTLIYRDDLGNNVDATLHHVIGGLQTGLGVKYSALKTEKHDFGLEIMPLLRYQATSISDIYSTLYLSDLPFPVRNIVRLEPARTFAVGGSIRLHYSYHISEKYRLGLMGAWQTDTNGDAIATMFLSLGRSF